MDNEKCKGCGRLVWLKKKGDRRPQREKIAKHRAFLAQIGVDPPVPMCCRCLSEMVKLSKKTGWVGDAVLVVFVAKKMRSLRHRERVNEYERRKRREAGMPTRAEDVAKRRKPLNERPWVKAGLSRNEYYFRKRCERDPEYPQRLREAHRLHCQRWTRKKSAARPLSKPCKHCGVGSVPVPRFGVGKTVCDSCKDTQIKESRIRRYQRHREGRIEAAKARQRALREAGFCGCGRTPEAPFKTCSKCREDNRRWRAAQRPPPLEAIV